jgi:hypothetical protein
MHPPFPPLPQGIIVVEAQVTITSMTFTLSFTNDANVTAFKETAADYFDCHPHVCVLTVRLEGGQRRRLGSATSVMSISLETTNSTLTSEIKAAGETLASGSIMAIKDKLNLVVVVMPSAPTQITSVQLMAVDAPHPPPPSPPMLPPLPRLPPLPPTSPPLQLLCCSSRTPLFGLRRICDSTC